MKTKHLFTTLLIFLISTGNLFAEPVWITIGTDAVPEVEKRLGTIGEPSKSITGVTRLQIDSKNILPLTYLMNTRFNRCGGFFYHENLAEASKALTNIFKRDLATKKIFVDYSIKNEKLVESLIAQVEEEKVVEIIEKLSSFHNRYYQAQTGVESSNWLKSHWEALANGNKSISVESFEHTGWAQPSIILSIQGDEKPEEVVILGGHADSIAGYWGGATNRAPGADDNASGLATISEVIRILFANNFKPGRTLKFMAYAAEEVGLRGSREIAKKYKEDGVNVVGVIQLDMTNYKGSNLDIVMMSDYTNHAQNEFIGRLIDRYVHVTWGYSKTGYAASDHASWTEQGYPASMPFESNKEDMNPNIHSARDTIAMSGDNAEHAVKFVKMALAFAVEMTR
ncbi:M20/M25/M40 family metallo-hydrolase [Candidatus Riflebacteria bacterium]